MSILQESEFSPDLLLEYIENNRSDLAKIDGDCKTCCMRKKCNRAHHIERIYGILETDPKDTNFPLLLSLMKKAPFILYLIPRWIFQKWPGYHNNLLGCPTVGIIDHVEQICECYNILNDEYSKQTYIAVLMYRLTYDARYLQAVYSTEAEYFEFFKNLSSDEVVVDCGAYTGDTLEQYLTYNDTPRKYILYEPDKYNLEKLKAFIEDQKASEYTIVRDVGVADKNEIRFFRDNMQMGSSFQNAEDNKGVKTCVVSIDEDNKKLDLPISFLKMDIEGFEKKALTGAKKTIEKYAPKMAICIYHSPNDLWDIILLIKEMKLPDPAFDVRHYQRYDFTDTILYVYGKETNRHGAADVIGVEPLSNTGVKDSREKKR